MKDFEVPDDDALWLRSLQTGDASQHPDAPHIREALKARAQLLDRDVPAADDQLYARLQFRLRQERLLKPSPGRRTLAVAASVVLAVGLGIALLPNLREPDHPVIRGTGSPNVVFVPDPLRSAQEAVGNLRTAGLEAELRSDNESAVVRVPASLEAVEALEKLKLPSERVEGQLEVRFVTRR